MLANYSVFVVDAAGHVCRSMSIVQNTDAEALQAAAAVIPAGHAAEVWLYGRMVGRVHGERESGAAPAGRVGGRLSSPVSKAALSATSSHRSGRN